MYLKKRKYQEEKVDLIYLIGQRRMLSKTEYAGKLLTQPYDRYREVYYQRRLVDLFEGLRDQIWFADRYLGEPQASRSKKPAEMRFVVVEDISYGMTRSDIVTCFGGHEDVLDVYITQNGVRRQYKRDVYINIAEGCDVDEFISSIGDQHAPYLLDLSGKQIREVCKITLSEAQGILDNFLRLHSPETSPNEPETGTDLEKIMLRLREEFLYCVVCSRQFDNYATMLRCCSAHSEDDFSQRSIEIASTPRDFSTIAYVDDDVEIGNFIIRTPESTFRCRSCQKLFEGFDFVKNHLSAKHPDIIQEVQGKKENFYRFIRNLDLFMLEIVEGTTDKRTPPFGRGHMNNNAVVYDFPHLFSGDVQI